MKNLKENKLRKKLNKNKLSDRQKNIIKRTAVIFILIIIICLWLNVMSIDYKKN